MKLSGAIAHDASDNVWDKLLAVAEEVDDAILRTGPGCQVMCRLEPELYRRYHEAVVEARHVRGG